MFHELLIGTYLLVIYKEQHQNCFELLNYKYLIIRAGTIVFITL